jgi:hypothetical protein
MRTNIRFRLVSAGTMVVPVILVSCWRLGVRAINLIFVQFTRGFVQLIWLSCNSPQEDAVVFEFMRFLPGFVRFTTSFVRFTLNFVRFTLGFVRFTTGFVRFTRVSGSTPPGFCAIYPVFVQTPPGFCAIYPGFVPLHPSFVRFTRVWVQHHPVLSNSRPIKYKKTRPPIRIGVKPVIYNKNRCSSSISK